MINDSLFSVGDAPGAAIADNLYQCEGPNCSTRFEAKQGRRFCSGTCRARAGDIRKAERLREALQKGELSDSDLRQIVKLLGPRLDAILVKKQGKPIEKLGPGHKRVLAWIDYAGGYGRFNPSRDLVSGRDAPLKFGDDRRARELVRVGILESRRCAYKLGVEFIRTKDSKKIEEALS